MAGWIGLALVACLAAGCATTPGREQPLGYFVSTAFSPDGTRIAATTTEGEVALFDANPLWFRRVLTSESDKAPVSRGVQEMVASVYRHQPLAFSPDGMQLVAAGATGTLLLWHLPSGTEGVRVPTGGPVMDLAYYPDGQTIVTAGARVGLWSASDGTHKGEIELPAGAKGTSVAVTPDSQLLLIGLSTGDIAVFETSTRAQVRSIKAHQAPVTSIAFQSDGAVFASNAGGYDLRLWQRVPGGGFEQRTGPVGPDSARETLERAQAGGALLWLLGTLRGAQIVGAPTLGAPPSVGSAESLLESAARATPFHCGPRVAFSRDGRYLVSTANLMRCADCIGTLAPSFLMFLTDMHTGNTATVRDLGCDVAIAPDGGSVAVGGPGAPQLRDMRTGERIPTTVR